MNDEGISIFLGAFLTLGGLAVARFRREFIQALSSISESQGRSIGGSYRRRMEWMALAAGLVFVLGGSLAIIASVT